MAPILYLEIGLWLWTNCIIFWELFERRFYSNPSWLFHRKVWHFLAYRYAQNVFMYDNNLCLFFHSDRETSKKYFLDASTASSGDDRWPRLFFLTSNIVYDSLHITIKPRWLCIFYFHCFKRYVFIIQIFNIFQKKIK